jgi:hypothetical protein
VVGMAKSIEPRVIVERVPMRRLAVTECEEDRVKKSNHRDFYENKITYFFDFCSS